jgi:hypothetical protein
MSVHKSELLRQLFAIEQHPYYHAKAFPSPFLYNVGHVLCLSLCCYVKPPWSSLVCYVPAIIIAMVT